LLTFGDELILGLQTTVVGMGVVFLTLFALSLILEGFRKMFYEKRSEQAVADLETVSETPGPGATIPQAGELVAVISAAIAASLGTTVSQFRVVGIREGLGKSSGWKTAGRTELIEKRQEYYE
jgi:sodium pump decarboxylase gamma subunit